ncbi:MAG: response regulator transcription factor [Chloroflexi bacterium]|nr:response regulator transcription factor [Chloroflexota bacterium]
MTDAIRVMIVDDHPMVRRGLKSLLTSYPDIQVVGEAGDGASALQTAPALSPDVILLDIQMPELNGVEVAHRLRRVAPTAKIIALTAFDNEEYVLSAMQAGVYAYLLKNTSDETVVEAIRQVHHGKHLVAPSLMDPVLKQFKALTQAHDNQKTGLTPEDLKVLAMIAQGATNEEIAKTSHWSERTVKREIEQIMSKLGARNRAQAVAEAIKRGLV